MTVLMSTKAAGLVWAEAVSRVMLVHGVGPNRAGVTIKNLHTYICYVRSIITSERIELGSPSGQ